MHFFLKGLDNQNRTTYYLINKRIGKVNFRFSEVSACTTIKRVNLGFFLILILLLLQIKIQMKLN